MKNINSQLEFNPFISNKHVHNGHDQIRHANPLHNDVNSRISRDISKAQDVHFSQSKNTTIGMKLVYQSISLKITNHSDAFTNQVKPESEVEKSAADGKSDPFAFDFEAVADNVLSFVSSSLLAAKNRGASSEEMDEMIAQARSGMNKGIDEAIAELGELLLLDDELSEGIEKSRSLISAGIDELEEKLQPTDDLTPRLSPTMHAIDYASETYHSTEKNSDLSITTADGDIITISFSEIKENQFNEQFNYSAGSDSSQLSYQSSASSYRELNFSYSVEGDLDDEEIHAINSLIEDISKIQKSFFNGNIEKAYEKALTLGYDEEQLNSFSLDLKLTQTSYVSQAYNEIASYNTPEMAELDQVIKPITAFVDQLRDVRSMANKLLDDDKQELNKLFESVFEAEHGINERLLKQFTNFTDKVV